ncbi:MAG: phosphoenolpyruvate--protein phosphotransferase [Streptococcaceae bacterium]|jgi:phosphotransferase system enzyme I (PtsI)|nr:phosphoenolpyruvate--protein phosphotransferase [Streptococcaceae bacterium]
MAEKLKGIAASSGVAVAKAYLLVQPDLAFETIEVTDTDKEEARLDTALAASSDELSLIKEKAEKSLGTEAAAVFDAHLMVLSDPEMIGQIKETIRAKKTNAEAALKEVTDMFVTLFEGMKDDNPYMAERAADIRDVTKRVLANLLGVTLPSPALIDEEVIIVAEDLTPSETAQLDKQFVKAFVTNIGGKTSHSAIMANTLEIPAVLGTGDITSRVKAGQLIAANGLTGEVVIDPDDATQAAFKQAGEDYQKQKAEWAALKDAATVTADGKHFELAANIGNPKDVQGANDNGAEAVGLYRTEFLYMDSDHFPTEDEQFEAYKAVLEGMNGKPVVVRTMDIGGDKKLPYFKLPDEMNPFLGWRALRISLSEGGNAMFHTQIRALLRASIYGHLRIMFPMVALVTEFRAAKKIVDEEIVNLKAEGQKVADNIEVGIMVEIPAAAVLADQFAKEVDFFSIGTNDLIQYTMAADRMNEQVSYLYQPYNPSILRLIKNVIDASHKEGKWTGMCGAMAGDQTAVPLLMGMGLDEFSMSATSVLQTRSLMKKLNVSDMEALANKALTECATVDEVITLVESATK